MPIGDVNCLKIPEGVPDEDGASAEKRQSKSADGETLQSFTCLMSCRPLTTVSVDTSHLTLCKADYVPAGVVDTGVTDGDTVAIWGMGPIGVSHSCHLRNQARPDR